MRTRMISGVTLLLISTILAAAVASKAQAQDNGLEYRGWGIRGGLSSDPDQVFFGAHFDLGEFAPGWHFIPNADIGFGDDQTLLSINPDVTYHFPVRDVGALYVGGLFALEWWHWDHAPDHVDDSETDLGLHIITGLVLDEAPVLFELNIGLVDAPDVKFAVGYTFTK